MSSMKAFFSSSFRLSLRRGRRSLLLGFLTQVGFGGQAAGEHGFGDAGDRHGEGQCGLHGPGAGAFMPAWSTMRSTSGLPVFLSTWCSTSAVISMR